jgi:glucosamine--fructose-6-phosphate aminotransferase (isomerizing)
MVIEFSAGAISGNRKIYSQKIKFLLLQKVYQNGGKIFMCGIIGYVGEKQASEVLIYGLKAMEYRGYDSAGISVYENDVLKTIKSVGKIKELESKITGLKNNHLGIAHTRWATHGGVTEENSHPHTYGKVTLVHNGIIENFQELKKAFKSDSFKSQTDSEVAAAVIDKYYDGTNPVEAIKKATKEFRGTYSFAIIFNGNHDKFYATRKGSPLIVGIGEEENFVASDISAILKYTKKYIDLKEGEIAEINQNKVNIYNENLIVTKKKILIADWDLADAQKNGYEHFMLKEINEQPELINKLKAKYVINNNIDCKSIKNYKRIDIVACGSAYHAGLVGKSLFEKYNEDDNIFITAEVASEYRYRKHNYNKKTLVIVISQSGETADTLACLRMANEQNVDTMAIVNVLSSSIAKEAKYVMPMLAGPEIAVATTKGYFTQVLDFCFLILNYLKEKEIINIDEYIKELDGLNKKVEKTIKCGQYEAIAQSIYQKHDIYFIGRLTDYTTLLEASLKLKEITYIHSDTYQAGELKHGPIALIDNETVVFVLITDESIKEKTLSNAIEAKSRGAKLILVTTKEMNLQKDLFESIIYVPTTTDFYQSIINIIPFQMIAYYVAKYKKCDIDKPKNLAKSVTVE